MATDLGQMSAGGRKLVRQDAVVERVDFSDGPAASTRTPPPPQKHLATKSMHESKLLNPTAFDKPTQHLQNSAVKCDSQPHRPSSTKSDGQSSKKLLAKYSGDLALYQHLLMKFRNGETIVYDWGSDLENGDKSKQPSKRRDISDGLPVLPPALPATRKQDVNLRKVYSYKDFSDVFPQPTSKRQDQQKLSGKKPNYSCPSDDEGFNFDSLSQNSFSFESPLVNTQEKKGSEFDLDNQIPKLLLNDGSMNNSLSESRKQKGEVFRQSKKSSGYGSGGSREAGSTETEYSSVFTSAEIPTDKDAIQQQQLLPACTFSSEDLELLTRCLRKQSSGERQGELKDSSLPQTAIVWRLKSKNQIPQKVMDKCENIDNLTPEEVRDLLEELMKANPLTFDELQKRNAERKLETTEDDLRNMGWDIGRLSSALWANDSRVQYPGHASTEHDTTSEEIELQISEESAPSNLCNSSQESNLVPTAEDKDQASDVTDGRKSVSHKQVSPSDYASKGHRFNGFHSQSHLANDYESPCNSYLPNGCGSPRNSPAGYGSPRDFPNGYDLQRDSPSGSPWDSSTGYGSPRDFPNGYHLQRDSPSGLPRDSPTGYGSPRDSLNGYHLQRDSPSGSPRDSPTGYGSPRDFLNGYHLQRDSPSGSRRDSPTGYGSPRDFLNGYHLQKDSPTGCSSQSDTSSGCGSRRDSPIAYGTPSPSGYPPPSHLPNDYGLPHALHNGHISAAESATNNLCLSSRAEALRIDATGDILSSRRNDHRTDLPVAGQKPKQLRARGLPLPNSERELSPEQACRSKEPSRLNTAEASIGASQVARGHASSYHYMDGSHMSGPSHGVLFCIERFTSCQSRSCEDLHCLQGKRLVLALQDAFQSDRIAVYRNILKLLHSHSTACRELECRVPFCEVFHTWPEHSLEDQFRTGSLSQRLQMDLASIVMKVLKSGQFLTLSSGSTISHALWKTACVRRTKPIGRFGDFNILCGTVSVEGQDDSKFVFKKTRCHKGTQDVYSRVNRKSSPYIVESYWCCIVVDSTLLICSAYQNLCSLHGYVMHPHYPMHLPLCLKLIQQVLQAVKFLHSKELEVAYLNWKCSSILWDGKTDGANIKLCNFSQAIRVPQGCITKCPNDFMSSYDPRFTAPEVFCDEPLTFSSDIWGVGCLLYEMLLKAPPYPGHAHESPAELRKLVCRHEIEPNIPVEDGLLEVFSNCWERCPANRWSVEDLRKNVETLLVALNDGNGPCEGTKMDR